MTISDRQQELSDFILQLPKAELHIHLEGSVSPETLSELSRRHPAPLVARNPAYTPAATSGREITVEQARELYKYADFTGFLFAFKTVTECLRTPEDFELITYRLMQDLRAQNVLHAEVYVSVGVYLWRGDDFDLLFEGMERGRQRGERDFGVSLLWLFDAVRQFGPDAARLVVEKAIGLREQNVEGFGIGGDERLAAPELFREVYGYARKHELRLTAHAGETTGPESIAGALDALGVERIGHALSAYQNPALVRRLIESQTPLEICLTSNLRTGCCRTIADHPLRSYFDQGALVTLNTDDPAMFETSLASEYQLAHEAFGFSESELRTLAANSFRASFLDDSRKRLFLQMLEGVPGR